MGAGSANPHFIFSTTAARFTFGVVEKQYSKYNIKVSLPTFYPYINELLAIPHKVVHINTGESYKAPPIQLQYANLVPSRLVRSPINTERISLPNEAALTGSSLCSWQCRK